MSITERSISLSDTLDSPAPDPVTGAGYIVLPQPDGLTAGDLMVVVSANSEDDSHAGLLPVGTGWTTIAGTGWNGGKVWISYKTATSADVAAATLKFGPLALGAVPPVLGNIAWLAYGGGVKTVTVTPGVSGSVVTSAPARVDGVAVTIYMTQGTVGSYGDAPTISGTGVTQRASFAPWGGGGFATQLVSGITIADEAVAEGDTSTAGSGLSIDGDVTVATGIVLMLEGNHAPRVPTVISPAYGATFTTLDDIDLALTAFLDIDTDDSASAVDFQYRVIGAGSWTSLAGSDALDGTGTIPGGTLVADDYEVQGQYEDQASAASGWSASRNFTVTDPATSPVITVPSSGATITTPTAAFDWTVDDQDEWQARVVGAHSGSPDPTTIYWDSGLVDASAARTGTAEYPVDGVSAYLQLRVKYGGAYSDWDSVPVTVRHAAPGTPEITSITTSDTEASIQIDWTCDTGDDPGDANAVSLWASSDDFTTRFQIATNQATSGSFIWCLPALNIVDYSFIVTAVNDYGVTVESAPAGSATGTSRDLRDTIVVPGGAPTS